MSRDARKQVFGFPASSDKDRPKQSRKNDRSFKFWTEEKEELHYQCSQNKELISCALTSQLICAFVFAYMQKSGFLMTRLK